MYSTSSGNFSTSSPTPSSASSERRDKESSSPHVRGGESGTAVTRPSYVSSPVTTPSAYLTLGGIGGGSSASISAASYLPSILDNNNIEQTFIDISSVPVSTSSSGTQHQQSGFVPPIIDPPPREPTTSFPREQTHPRDLSVSREVTVGTCSEAPNRDRAPTRQEPPISGRDFGSGDRTNEFNNNNNIIRSNDNIARKTAGKNARDATNILRGAHSYGDNMVATNAAMTLQGQLGNWNIPVTMGGSVGANAGNHQLAHHHSLGGQHSLNQSLTASSVTPQKQQGGPRRHTGPRPPKNESNLSPEEAERRRVRRERNKLAAAKCRKRRMDHTAQLQDETEELESVQKEIHNEILSLQQQKEQLEFILQAHKVHCKRGIPFTALPAVYIPPLTLGSGGGDDGGLKEELAGNLSNDSHSSTTSNYSPAPAALQMQMTTTTAMTNAVARPTNSINNNGGNAVLTLATVMGKNNNNGADGTASPNHISTAMTTAAAHRPTSLPIKQEPPFVKTESHNQHQQQPTDGVDVKPEAMDVSVTQATGISISTPKVSPRVLSFFDVMGDHTGLTPITGGGVITSVGSATGTPVSTAGATGLPSASTPPTTKMGTPTDRSNNDAEKPNSGQQHTLMSL